MREQQVCFGDGGTSLLLSSLTLWQHSVITNSCLLLDLPQELVELVPLPLRPPSLRLFYFWMEVDALTVQTYEV